MRRSVKTMLCMVALLAVVTLACPAVSSAFEIAAGDQIVVTHRTDLMIGSEILGVIDAGRSFRVLERQGDWVGVSTNVKGHGVAGWLLVRDLRAGAVPTPSPVPAPTNNVTAQQNAAEYYRVPVAGEYRVDGRTPVINNAHYFVPEIHHWTPWGY